MAKHPDPKSTVSRDVDAFMRLLNLPARPIEVWWEETPVGTPGGLGPTDYDLRAVIRFDDAVTEGLAKSAPPLPGSPARLSSGADRPWLPPPVRAAIQPFDAHSIAVRGSKFDAAPLLKWPYRTGAFIIVEGTAYVFLGVRTT